MSTTGIVALSDEDIRAALWTRLLSEAAHGAIGALTLQSLGAIGSEAPSVSLATVSPTLVLLLVRTFEACMLKKWIDRRIEIVFQEMTLGVWFMSSSVVVASNKGSAFDVYTACDGGGGCGRA